MRSAFLRACLALAAALAVAACGPALLPTDPARIPAWVGANGEFKKPAGPGPFPAVVIMHGCGGPPGHQEWIGRLNEWGYATYYIDSFTPRNLKHVCAEQQFKGVERVDDAYAALAHLRTRSEVRADRLATDLLILFGEADDGPRPPHEFLGHRLEYNEAAARDSFARTKAFFDQRLRD